MNDTPPVVPADTLNSAAVPLHVWGTSCALSPKTSVGIPNRDKCCFMEMFIRSAQLTPFCTPTPGAVVPLAPK